MYNGSDDVLIVMNNGYTSATGGQAIPSTQAHDSPRPDADADRAFAESGSGASRTIEAALRGVGVKWVRRVRTYSVGAMVKTLRAALTGPTKGLKVIVADGECQLMRQRRYRPWFARRVKAGRRAVRTRFGVDDDVCTGDHSCIRLSGCPSLTVKESADPLRTDPVAHVANDCVGCGLCGEVAHAAVLCPSFYRAEVVNNPSLRDRLLHGLRSRVIGALARG